VLVGVLTQAVRRTPCTVQSDQCIDYLAGRALRHRPAFHGLTHGFGLGVRLDQHSYPTHGPASTVMDDSSLVQVAFPTLFCRRHEIRGR